MIGFTSRGSFDKTEAFLRRAAQGNDISHILARYGQAGVDALSNATPRESGLTGDSWYYTIESSRGSQRLVFHNRNIQDGRPIAILIQYGHGTGTGGYVEGRDYINPALKPIFDRIANEVGRELRR